MKWRERDKVQKNLEGKSAKVIWSLLFKLDLMLFPSVETCIKAQVSHHDHHRGGGRGGCASSWGWWWSLEPLLAVVISALRWHATQKPWNSKPSSIKWESDRQAVREKRENFIFIHCQKSGVWGCMLEEKSPLTVINAKRKTSCYDFYSCCCVRGRDKEKRTQFRAQ